jgi:hypothetical protein
LPGLNGNDRQKRQGINTAVVEKKISGYPDLFNLSAHLLTLLSAAWIMVSAAEYADAP